MARSISVVVGLLLTVASTARGQVPAFDLEAALSTVGAQLERRFEQVQRIVSTEMVWVRSFTHGMQSGGSPRRLEFERRVEWGTFEDDGVPSVTVVRELRAVNGREPTEHDRNACLTPRAQVEDPLSVLLPVRQAEFDFSLGTLEWQDGRQVARIDFAPRAEGSSEVTWDDDCVSIALRGWSRGQAWVDVESGDVLRLDQKLARQFEFRRPRDRTPLQSGWIVLQRDDMSTRYERVTFADPDESLMLPRSTEHLWTIRGGGFHPRYLRSQEFSNHRRFVTAGRVVGIEPSPVVRETGR